MADRPRVFVARRVPAAGLERIGTVCDIDLWEDPTPPARDVLLRRVSGVDGVLTLLTERVDEGFLDAAGPSLRVVSNYAVGFDNIDVAACVAHGVAVGNTPGVLTETTADLAFALILASARRLPEAERFVRAEEWSTWDPISLLGSDVHGSTLGIIGFGRIGQAVARRAGGFGMRVLCHGRRPIDTTLAASFSATPVSLDELLANSDFVSLHVNLSAETRHLIDAERLAQMKPTAVIVNTSRGAVIDQAALADALDAHRIASAALDVTDPEPIAIDDRLFRRDDCLIVPHIGSATRATRTRMAEMAADNLVAGVLGRPLPTPVDRYEGTG